MFFVQVCLYLIVDLAVTCTWHYGRVLWSLVDRAPGFTIKALNSISPMSGCRARCRSEYKYMIL